MSGDINCNHLINIQILDILADKVSFMHYFFLYMVLNKVNKLT